MPTHCYSMVSATAYGVGTISTALRIAGESVALDIMSGVQSLPMFPTTTRTHPMSYAEAVHTLRTEFRAALFVNPQRRINAPGLSRRPVQFVDVLLALLDDDDDRRQVEAFACIVAECARGNGAAMAGPARELVRELEMRHAEAHADLFVDPEE